MTTVEIYTAIADERIAQIAKWGNQQHDDLRWLGILAEEFGKAAMAVTECAAYIEQGGDPENYDKWAARRNKKLVSSAAVIVAWLETLATLS